MLTADPTQADIDRSLEILETLKETTSRSTVIASEHLIKQESALMETATDDLDESNISDTTDSAYESSVSNEGESGTHEEMGKESSAVETQSGQKDKTLRRLPNKSTTQKYKSTLREQYKGQKSNSKAVSF